MAENTNYQQGDLKGKVIKGEARLEKPGIRKRVLNFLFSDKLDSIGTYLTQYILGPSLRDLVFKMGTGALQMALFGNGSVARGSGPNVPNGQPAPIAYYQMSNPGYTNNGFGFAQPQGNYYQPHVSINDISFQTRDDAYLAFDRMCNILRAYNRVYVKDYYDAAGITCQDNWAIQGLGWFSLADAKPVSRLDGRWIIQFPPVQRIG